MQVRFHLANVQQEALPQDLNLMEHDYCIEPRRAGVDRPDEVDSTEEQKQGHDAQDYSDLLFHRKGELYCTPQGREHATTLLLLLCSFGSSSFVRFPHPLNKGIHIDDPVGDSIDGFHHGKSLVKSNTVKL